ncbi:MAG: hypothetical protein ACREE0_05655 [Phenylobacterium sp.]
MRSTRAAAIAAGAFMMSAISDDRAAAQNLAVAPCAAPLSGTGKILAVPRVLTEVERIALSNAIYRALRGPTDKRDWPEALIDAAPACVRGAFPAGGDTYVFSGGAAPLPPRWAKSPTNEMLFFLAEGNTDASGLEDAGALSRRPYFLVAVGDRERIVLYVYDGPPDERKVQADIAASLLDGFTPVAAYDPDGDAVTLFKSSDAGLSAQLFGPAPTPERAATIYGPDGRYFVPDDAVGTRMRGSGMPCPDDLSGIEQTRMTIMSGADPTLDLACHYESDDVIITLFATKTSRNSLGNWFRESLRDARKDVAGVHTTPNLVPAGGPGQFEFGQSWLGQKEQLGGLWMGRRNGYVIEVRADWTVDSYRSARDAIKALQALAFEDGFTKAE